MKDRRSKLLRAFVADIERAERPTRADAAWLARPSPYPFGIRDAVFCWLWANHDHVAKMRGGVPPRLGWEGFAAMMREDGVVGSRGEPPNANSVRRVWVRVCREKEEREAKEGSAHDLSNSARLSGHSKPIAIQASFERGLRRIGQIVR